jgi:oxygen-independent coproporphyrinogen-3 oxidase
MNPGLYIHIPFCEQRCYYCAFTVAVSPEAAFEPYFQRLVRELEISGFAQEPKTVYLGGGTPSLVPPAMLARLMSRIPGTPHEVTIEVNPGTLSSEKVDCYREIGISRISLGAQSLEDEDLDRAGRLHRAAAVFQDYDLLRRHGFTNVNLDLIAGLPRQKMETWCRNLDHVLSLRPEHISIYMLDREERSAWGRVAPGIPGENDFAAFYTEAESRLGAEGYEHYEISNWAQPGFQCRHNQGYWNGAPYRGIGVGAHSYDGVRRFWNTSSLADYAERIDRGELPILEEEVLTPSMRREEAFMLGLRQASGLDVAGVARNLGIRYPSEWFDRVRQLQEAGWIQYDGACVKLTAEGRLAANSVIEELLWPTPSSTFEATL